MTQPTASQGDAAQTGGAVGALAATGAVLCFSVNDVVIKALSDSYALHQIVLIRSLVAFSMVLVIAFCFGKGLAAVRTRRLPEHLLRGSFVLAANMLFFLGLAAMPLAEAVAIFFVSPMLITAFSVIFLGEHVGPRRWAAVIVGFMGVLIIVRPGTEAFQLASILPILAAVCYASLHMMTRRLGSTESTTSMVFYIQLLFIGVSTCIGLAVGDGRFGGQDDPSLAFFFRAWAWPALADWGLMVLLGVILAAAAFMISFAYKVSEAALVAPFEYIAMPLAVIWGIILFAEWPDGTTWLGMALILGAGLFIIWRERRPGPQARRSGGEPGG